MLIRPLAHSKQTDGGLFLPDTYFGEQEVSGTVVARGTRMKDDDIEVGKVVFFSPYVGQETNLYGERLFVMRESDILAVEE